MAGSSCRIEAGSSLIAITFCSCAAAVAPAGFSDGGAGGSIEAAVTGVLRASALDGDGVDLFCVAAAPDDAALATGFCIGDCCADTVFIAGGAGGVVGAA